MSKLCFDKEATLLPGEIWPSEPWLDELSQIIWRLSSLHRQGGNDLWSCIKAIDNRYRTLKLSGKIERLVDRAGKSSEPGDLDSDERCDASPVVCCPRSGLAKRLWPGAFNSQFQCR
jgi:hypothetical protein